MQADLRCRARPSPFNAPPGCGLPQSSVGACAMPGSRGRWGRGGRGHSESRVADAPSGPPRPFSASITPEVSANLKVTPEQTLVVGPLVEFLRQRGWAHEQIVYGRREWRIPKNLSEAAKREGSRRFDAYPCDIAIFEA